MYHNTFNMAMLVDVFEKACIENKNYVAVKVSIGDSSVEYIIVKKKDFKAKLSYYREAYHHWLCLKANNSVKITDAVGVNDFADAEKYFKESKVG